MLEKLQSIGLSRREAQVYLEVAKFGEVSANDVAKELSLQRTVSYNVLQQLVGKGFVNFVLKNKKRYYSLSNPNSLRNFVKEKELIVEQLISDINKVTKKINSSKNVEVYEGKEGMKVVFDKIRKAKNLKALNATGKIFDYLEYSASHIVKDIKKFGKPKVIACNSMKKTKLADFKINVKYLPSSAENLATTFIFENQVVIQVLNERPFLIRIESKDVFEGFSKDFDVLWNKLD